METGNNAWFTYADRTSLDMGLYVTRDTSYTSPEYDVTFEEVVGRDGDLTVDNNRLKSFVYPIHAYVNSYQDIDYKAYEISKWLKDDVRYKPLELSWDPDYTYQAIFFEQFDITEMLPTFGRVSLNFRVHPIKYRTDSLRLIELESGSGLFNPEPRSSEPLISIEGSGDIILQNNGKDWLKLRDVEGSITVNTALQVVYKEDRNEFSKMSCELDPLFPVLESGENELTWSGDVTSLKIAPRWEAVV